MARYIDADKLREYWLENGVNENIYNTNNVLGSIDYQPTAEVAEVKQWLGHIQNDNHFPEVTKMVKAIALIEDYVEEPNSIAPDWLEALKLCLRLLREKVDGGKTK